MKAVVWQHQNAAIGVVTKVSEFHGRARLVTHAAGELCSPERFKLRETCSPLLGHTPLSVEKARFHPLGPGEPGTSIV